MAPVRVRDIRDYISKLAGGLNQDEGLHFGDPNAEVRKIVVCWMADVEALKFASEVGANLIVTHESLFYPYDVVVNGKVPEFLAWRVNLRRASILAGNGISVIRAHGALDKACIFDDFASLLGLPEPTVSEEGFVKIYDIEPVTYGDLIQRVKEAVGMAQVRVTNGERSRLVRRVGLPWGGLGLFVNVGYMQKLVDHNCEVFIAGETDNYGLRFAIDAGIDLIETSHEVSENPGLRRFARLLGEAFSGIPVEFFENRIPWVYA